MTRMLTVDQIGANRVLNESERRWPRSCRMALPVHDRSSTIGFTTWANVSMVSASWGAGNSAMIVSKPRRRNATTRLAISGGGPVQNVSPRDRRQDGLALEMG